MDKFKRKLKIFVTLCISACITLSAIGCGTASVASADFGGKMSTVAYEEIEDAAKAFFDEQINSNEHEDCRFSMYSPKKELSHSDIGGLDLGDYTEEDIIWAERGKVSFAYGNEVFVNDVYILQTEEGYHYYSVLPDDEEAVTYDYYEFLTNEEKFVNVTVKTKSMIIVEGNNFSRQSEINYEFYFTEDKVKFSVSIKNFFNGGVSETVLSGYILIDGEDYSVYGMNEKSEYVDISQEFNGLFAKGDNLQLFLTNKLADLYKQGSHLFKVNEDTLVLKEKEKSLLSEWYIQEYYGEEKAQVDSLSCGVELENRQISKISTNVHSFSEVSGQHTYVTIETVLSKFGKTEVELPEELLILFEESQSEHYEE